MKSKNRSASTRGESLPSYTSAGQRIQSSVAHDIPGSAKIFQYPGIRATDRPSPINMSITPICVQGACPSGVVNSEFYLKMDFAIFK